jgi:peptidyl-tRNA hydrolase
VTTTATTTTTTTSSSSSATADPATSDLVQYVVLRRDLLLAESDGGLGWPLGAVVSQACHAAVAAVSASRGDPATEAYICESALGTMSKVTLGVKGRAQLETLAARLARDGVVHHLWHELPENVPTALASRPGPRALLAPHFRKLNLLK